MAPVAIAVVASLLLLGVGGLVLSYRTLVSDLDAAVVHRASPPSSEKPEEELDGPLNLLILGSDTREGQTSGSYGDSSDVSGARSDTIMMLHVPRDRSGATIISIPRDTMIPIPSCTRPDGTEVESRDIAMINSALNDGPYCSLDAVRQFTGIDITDFIVFDFDGVVEVVDALGGVEICSEHPIHDEHSGLSLDTGCHVLGGVNFLAFLRTRYAFGDGSDLGRIASQHSLLTSLIRQTQEKGLLTRPGVAFELAQIGSRSLSISPSLGSPQALASLIVTLARVGSENITFAQLPVEEYWADPNRVQPQEVESRELFATLRGDD